MSRGYTQRVQRYDAPGEGLEEDPFVAADLAMTKSVSEVIERHYGGHPWLVEVSHEQGVVMISIPLFMGPYKYIIKIHDLKTDPGFRSVVLGCGELLERYRIPRQKFSEADFLSALSAIPLNRRARTGLLLS